MISSVKFSGKCLYVDAKFIRLFLFFSQNKDVIKKLLQSGKPSENILGTERQITATFSIDDVHSSLLSDTCWICSSI